MVRLEEHKETTENRSIETMPLPQRAYVPLGQHIGKICEPQVKIGDSVLRGQRIAAAQAHVYAPIHAPISGKVVAIQEWPHPLLGRCRAIVIEGDGLDRSQSHPSTALGAGQATRSPDEIIRLSPDEIRNIVFEAGIVGMGGASFPTHIKLNPPQPVDTLIINGAECEPYLTSDYRLMLEKAAEIIKGVELIARCLGVKRVIIAIEDNKPGAIKAFKAICDKRYAIRILKTEYPQGGERQLIKNVTGKEVPSGKLPFDIGVVVHNVATVYAVYEAVYLYKPLYERVVTVTGECLMNPKNLLVRIGTPVKELIERCGPMIKQVKKLVFGGPMMGVAQFSLEAPVIKSTNGIILFSESQVKLAEEELCIRCSRCVQQCPAGLMPCMILLASEKEKWDLAKAYNCLDCMECGVCSYACPQKLDLVQAIKLAKAKAAK